MRLKASLSRRAILALAAILVASSSFGATVTKVNDDALAPLRTATIAKKIRLDRLPLHGSRSTPIDLEEFQVWAPDGKVFVHGKITGMVATKDDNFAIDAVARRVDRQPRNRTSDVAGGAPDNVNNIVFEKVLTGAIQ